MLLMISRSMIIIFLLISFQYIVSFTFANSINQRLLNKVSKNSKLTNESLTKLLSSASETINDSTIIAQSQKLEVLNSSWPCGDQLDKRILQLAAPAVLNFAIFPLVGAVDTFWVGRMENALALAGQAAANQVFSSAFWIVSFLPSIVTPLVAKAAGTGDKEKLRNNISEAVFVGLIMAFIGSLGLFLQVDRALSLVLSPDKPALSYAKPYLLVRAITFIPAVLSTVGFAAFRGTLDVITPLKIAIFSNLINVLLDPILIFHYGFGVAGAAAATCVAELISFLLYVTRLTKLQMINYNKIFKLPSWEAIKPLLLGGLSIQFRAVALNIAFIAVTRTTQALDTTGVAAAAHAITVQSWQLGGVFLLAMSSVASIIIPIEVAKAKREDLINNNNNGMLRAKAVADRLLLWGIVLGFFLGFMQLLSLPLLKVFSPLKEVQEAARIPAILGAILQLLNGVVFIGEGIQQGNQYFTSMAIATAFGTAGMLTSLKFFGKSLIGVWGSFAVFNSIRLLGVLRHHFLDGPFAKNNINNTNPIVKTSTQ